MAGENAQNQQKLKVKSNEDLTEEVHRLENSNEFLQGKIKELERTVKEVVKQLGYYQEEIKTVKGIAKPDKEEFKCAQCEQTCSTKKALKDHRKENHTKSILCQLCDESFLENWKLETHLKTHAEAKKFKCDTCSKEFSLEWRMRKHMESHENKNGKRCHYFNNFKTCPYEEIGCKYLHEVSDKCYFKKCLNSLCQFQHTSDENEKENKDEQENVDKTRGFTKVTLEKQVIEFHCVILKQIIREV